MNNLDTTLTVLQIVSIAILLPLWAYKAWAKLDARLTEQDKQLERIDAQFHRNGGSSLRDQNDRIERDLARLTGRFDQHIEDGK